ncbi:MAG: hypothetical protein ACREBU_09720 [Nitrososphaera sp.]
MFGFKDYQVTLKGEDRASILIQHVRRIVNNNKSPEAWTEEERKNPVIFDKQIQTFVSMAISIVRDKESARVLSGGNFDFKDSAGAGYFLVLKYIDNDDAVKEVLRSVREGCGFSCIAGPTSASCFLAANDPADKEKEATMRKICDVLKGRLSKLKAKT